MNRPVFTIQPGTAQKDSCELPRHRRRGLGGVRRRVNEQLDHRDRIQVHNDESCRTPRFEQLRRAHDLLEKTRDHPSQRG